MKSEAAREVTHCSVSVGRFDRLKYVFVSEFDTLVRVLTLMCVRASISLSEDSLHGFRL